MGDWLGAVLEVANIAAKLIHALLEDDPIKAPEFPSKEIGLNFTYNSDSSGHGVSDYWPVPVRKAQDMTKTLQFFADGVVTAAPVESDSELGVRIRTVSFSAAVLAVGVASTLVPGYSLTFKKIEGGWNANIEVHERATMPEKVEIEIEGINKAKMYVEWPKKKSEAAPADNTIEIPLPPGLEIEPVVNNVSVTMQIDESWYEEFTAERRKLALSL